MNTTKDLIDLILNAGSFSLVLAMVFVATFLLIVGVTAWLFGGESAKLRRLREIGQGEKAYGSQPHKEGMFDVKWVKPIAELVLPKEDWKRSRIKQKLVLAGYLNPSAIKTFMVSKVMLALFVPIMVVLPMIIMGIIPITKQYLPVITLVLGALLGYYLPDFILYRKRVARQLHFIEGFPDAMDMLVVCVEAGLGIDAAIARVGEEMLLSHPEMSREFQLVSLELRAGKSRDDALRALAERTGVRQVQSLTALLIQAEHFGTSIATALREHAEEMRLMRMQNAKEKAAKLPVKLVFPLMFFIFPALFLVVLGPALVRIFTTFFNYM